MARVMLLVASIAVGLVLLGHRFADDDGGSPAPPQVSTSSVPKEFRPLFAHGTDAASLLASRGALPGLGAIRRLAGGSDDAAPAIRPFADVGSRREVLGVRRDIRRDVAALNRLSDRERVSRADAARTLAEIYSAPVLAALGPEGRSAFAARLAGATDASQKIRVVDFGGIFVAGDRALAQVIYRLSIREPSGRYVARAPETWTVTLAREDGHWRFVRGFEES